MITVHRKPRKCPSCGSTRIANILYGMRGYSEQLQKDLDDGRIVLGGCGISFDNPDYECVGCGETFKRQPGKYSAPDREDEIPF